MLRGGKRMRPLLVYAAGAAFGATVETLDAPAVAVELVHAYSLVHDDLAAVDDDYPSRPKKLPFGFTAGNGVLSLRAARPEELATLKLAVQALVPNKP